MAIVAIVLALISYVGLSGVIRIADPGANVAVAIVSMLLPIVSVILGFVDLKKRKAAEQSPTMSYVAIVLGGIGVLFLIYNLIIYA